MAKKYLVIVESPAKVKTIKKFLGSDYEVMASNGHVRDLPKSRLGIDVEHDYEPKYITIRGKGDVLAALRKEVKKAEKVYLATDPDREGEAISWHLSQGLKIDEEDIYRITFNEITKNAVKESIKHPRKINLDLVNAQQTRRMLDRMVGYRISPVLWDKVKRGLSAGRVQSAALRIICDREEEINRFIPEEYWNLEAHLAVKGIKKPLVSKYYGKDGKKSVISNHDELNQVLAELENQPFVIADIKHGERLKNPPKPYTTSTLQQDASNSLNFSTQKTMRIAQQLYEGVEIEGEGTIGIITYLRTDSTRIAAEADQAARAYIKETYGEEFVIDKPIKKEEEQKIQDAHEAIRPTNIRLTPAQVRDSLSRDQYRLYKLIWERFTASRMSSACYDTIQVKIDCGIHRFTASSSQIRFMGFMNVYNDEEKPESSAVLMQLKPEAQLELVELVPSQHFTQPPAHFTEASLVKTLEELGIGRPSTYAPTITTLIARNYVTKENKNLYVTELGEIVNGIMKQAFGTIVDVQFTANMESLLDMIAEGKVKWKDVVSNFYPDLDSAVEAAEKNLEKIQLQDEETDEICELCGRNMVIKYGPHGKFLACPGFPECRNTKPYLEKIGVPCPKCGKEIVVRKSKKGRRFYGCEDSQNCDFISWAKPSAKSCPKCGSYMVEKGKKMLCSNTECGFVENREESDN
ncbi:MAG: type I DNA topoisomerase [Lachnospiraceae bacterium]